MPGPSSITNDRGHVLRLTPVPKPATIAIAALGLMSLLWRGPRDSVFARPMKPNKLITRVTPTPERRGIHGS